MAQKVAEEAKEAVIEAVRGERWAVINELGIAASEIWAEMDRRQALFGMAEKLPKEAGVDSTPPNRQ